jgi:hypothetical protein
MYKDQQVHGSTKHYVATYFDQLQCHPLATRSRIFTTKKLANLSYFKFLMLAVIQFKILCFPELFLSPTIRLYILVL